MIVVITTARGQLFTASAHWTASSARSSVVFFYCIIALSLSAISLVTVTSKTIIYRNLF